MPDFMDDIVTSLSEAVDEIADRLPVGPALPHSPSRRGSEARSAS
jgi:hypothetical protein